MAYEKKFGDKVLRNGRWFYWCPEHKYEGFYDGLYVTHPPEKNAKWKDKQYKMKGRRKYANKSNNGNNSNSSSSGSSTELKLVLSDSVQQALITDHGFNSQQIEQLERLGR